MCVALHAIDRFSDRAVIFRGAHCEDGTKHYRTLKDAYQIRDEIKDTTSQDIKRRISNQRRNQRRIKDEEFMIIV